MTQKLEREVSDEVIAERIGLSLEKVKEIHDEIIRDA